MTRNLLILGSGQYGAVVKEIAAEMGCFQKIAFLDDSYNNSASDKRIIGKLRDLPDFISEYNEAIPAIGNPYTRKQLMLQVKQCGLKIPQMISPRSYVADSARLGVGVVVEPLSGVHTGAVIGDCSYISMGAVVNHNAIVENYCHIDNNAVVMSSAKVTENTTTRPCEVIPRDH